LGHGAVTAVDNLETGTASEENARSFQRCICTYNAGNLSAISQENRDYPDMVASTER
jgi:hypothetical protein